MSTITLEKHCTDGLTYQKQSVDAELMEKPDGMSPIKIEHFLNSTKMKIAILSDLHLDSYENSEEVRNSIYESIKENKVDWILNAGDMYSSYKPFELEDNEIYVPGNHDYYFSDKHPIEDGIRYHALNDEWVCLSVTLWTELSKDGLVGYKDWMNDCRCITGWKPLINNEVHHAQLRQLKDTLELIGDKKVIIMTHHSPSFKSVSPRFFGHPMNSAFHNNLDGFIKDNPNIKYWVHGHTHARLDYNIGETRVICNPLGYSGENAFFEPVYIEL